MLSENKFLLETSKQLYNIRCSGLCSMFTYHHWKSAQGRANEEHLSKACAPARWPWLRKPWQWWSDPASEWTGAVMGLLPSKQQECSDECFREGSETRPIFFFFLLFFLTGLSMGNFPRTTPLLFHRDVCPHRTLWVVSLRAKGRGKEKEKGGKIWW